jgi:hypothetical protein
MAVQAGKSSLFQKYGTRLNQAVQQHAADPTEYGRMALPGGITGGIAKIIECTFAVVAAGKQNAGEYYFRAAAVVVEPESIIVDGREVTVAGLQTSIIEMVCDTKTKDGKVTTQEEHVASILNTMRTIAGPEFTKSKNGVDLEVMAEQIKKAAPYIRFSTSIGKKTPEYPEPRVWENWYGSKGLENYQPPQKNAVQDDSEQVQEASETQVNGQVSRTQLAPPKIQTKANSSADEFKEAEEAQLTRETEIANPLGDVASLIEKANEGDKSSMNKLKQLAMNLGVSEEDVDNAADWGAVGEMIVSNTPVGEETINEVSNVPQVGETWNWKVTATDKTTKKKTVAKVATRHEIMEIDSEKGTCSLKSFANPKLLFKNVPLTTLEALEA